MNSLVLHTCDSSGVGSFCVPSWTCTAPNILKHTFSPTQKVLTNSTGWSCKPYHRVALQQPQVNRDWNVCYTCTEDNLWTQEGPTWVSLQLPNCQHFPYFPSCILIAKSWKHCSNNYQKLCGPTLSWEVKYLLRVWLNLHKTVKWHRKSFKKFYSAILSCLHFALKKRNSWHKR